MLENMRQLKFKNTIDEYLELQICIDDNFTE